jgi:6-phosphogluconate dehydrogenase
MPYGCFAEWNRGDLNSYLIGITADILPKEGNGKPLVDSILDTAGQRHRKWASVVSSTSNFFTLISEAVYAVRRAQDERVLASRVLKVRSIARRRSACVHRRLRGTVCLEDRLYAQGFALLARPAGSDGS